jgi:hypothetical protein
MLIKTDEKSSEKSKKSGNSNTHPLVNANKAASIPGPMPLTKHAESRLAQRGFLQGDVSLIAWLGTEVEGGLSSQGEGLSSLRPRTETSEGPSEAAGGQAGGS